MIGNLKYIPSESTKQPQTIEVGVTTVYLRKDINKVVVTENDQEITYWRYQEAALSHDEFNQYSSLIASENAIKDVDNAENIRQILDGQTTGDTNQLIIMEAIADLWDAIASLI